MTVATGSHLTLASEKTYRKSSLVDVKVLEIHCMCDVSKSFVLLICLRLYVLVNNFSVILGQLPGFNWY